MGYEALAHRRNDHVAVAVTDLAAGADVAVRVLEGGDPIVARAVEAIPLGHKMALIDLPEGADVIEYGARIGRTTRPIKAGEHAHVHNIKSVRWSV